MHRLRRERERERARDRWNGERFARLPLFYYHGNMSDDDDVNARFNIWHLMTYTSASLASFFPLGCHWWNQFYQAKCSIVFSKRCWQTVPVCHSYQMHFENGHSHIKHSYSMPRSSLHCSILRNAIHQLSSMFNHTAPHRVPSQFMHIHLSLEWWPIAKLNSLTTATPHKSIEPRVSVCVYFPKYVNSFNFAFKH